MSDAKTIAVYDARANDYADMVRGLAEDPRFSDFADRLPERGRVLDLGCGPGNAAAELAKRDFEVLAWDASAEMIALARAHGTFTAEQRLFSELPALSPGHFDGVWANFSLLHAPRDDMPGHLGALAAALKAGGVFLVALKAGDGAHRDSIGRLYTYYTEVELTDLVEAAGFTVVRRDTGRDKGLSGEDSDWISLTCLR